MSGVIILFFATLFLTQECLAGLKVVTTTTTLQSLVQNLAGDRVEVTTLSRPGQNPHFLEAKPSYIVVTKNADLLVLVGLDLESGWLPSVINGARNPRIQPGKPGYFETGSLIEPLEKPTTINRAAGHVHPLGNPHFYLDPRRIQKVVQALSDRLAMLDPANAEFFSTQNQKFQNQMEAKMKDWQKQAAGWKLRSFVTYHRTLSYFFARFDLTLLDTIEPKPGIPPTARHIVELQNKMKHGGCVLYENDFGREIENLFSQTTQIRLVKVATEVGNEKGISSYIDLIEHLIQAVKNCQPKDPRQ